MKLTRQEQLIACVVFGLFLLGLAVRAYLIANPPQSPPPTTNSSEKAAKQ